MRLKTFMQNNSTHVWGVITVITILVTSCMLYRTACP